MVGAGWKSLRGDTEGETYHACCLVVWGFEKLLNNLVKEGRGEKAAVR